MDSEADDLITEFTEGFYERVEYTRGATGSIEQHVEARWQVGLLAQLRGVSLHIKAVSTEPSGGKPKSQPPCDLDALELLEACTACVVSVQETGEPIKRLRKLRDKARLLLGYDAPLVVIRDTVCGACGGALIVARDASTSVRCVGTDDEDPCGTEYPRHSWIQLLDGGTT